MQPVLISPIAVVHTPYKEKFVTPRQAGLAPSVMARIEFLPDFASVESVQGLEGFSHIWLLFLFHHHLDQGWSPRVRPPRLGGNQRVGVFASRAPFRPNPLGLSAVKLLKIHSAAGSLCLDIQGADLVDGTPIVDIKPYIPYADSIPDARGGFAQAAPHQCLDIRFNEPAQHQLDQFSRTAPGLEIMIRETLCLDPRPAYRQGSVDKNTYGCLLDRFNIRWQVWEHTLLITDISIAN